MFGGGKVMPYEELGIYPLLHRGGAQREEWKAFAERVLEPLRAYDEKHQTELVRTLRLFFDVGTKHQSGGGATQRSPPHGLLSAASDRRDRHASTSTARTTSSRCVPPSPSMLSAVKDSGDVRRDIIKLAARARRDVDSPGVRRHRGHREEHLDPGSASSTAR